MCVCMCVTVHSALASSQNTLGDALHYNDHLDHTKHSSTTAVPSLLLSEVNVWICAVTMWVCSLPLSGWPLIGL